MGLKRINTRKTPELVNKLNSMKSTPMKIEDMIITTPKGRCYFERLRYKNCPPVKMQKNSGVFCIDFDKKILMNRDSLIISLYEVFLEWEPNCSFATYFKILVTYFIYLDNGGREVNFSEENIIWFGNELLRKTTLSKEQGGIKSDSARRIRSLLSKILCAQGLYAEASKLPAIRVKNKEVEYIALSDESYVEVGKFLFNAYEIYMQHIINNTQPELCPLFDEERLKRLGLSKEEILFERRKARLRVAGYTANWLNSAINIAILLIYMFTGINPTPLFNLRHSDVKLKKNAGNVYILETVKARAGYKRQTNEIGFTAFSKSFIETWLLNTKKWSSDPNFLVFPRVIRNNETNETRWGTWLELSPQRYINKILEIHGLPKISAMIFRKTRSSMLMRALDDIAEVADANNNNIATTNRHYIYGNKDIHDRKLAATFQVQAEMASGVDKKEAIDNSFFKFKDPLTEIEYINARYKRPSKTKSGLGCDGNLTNKINKAKRKYKNINPEQNSCIDFLDCFECPSHALVAELDDIWMMLSFQDSLNEVLERPSLNSVPSDRFFKIKGQVEFILDKLKNKVPHIYDEACEKNKYRAHPLYDDSNAIDDLMGIYA